MNGNNIILEPTVIINEIASYFKITPEAVITTRRYGKSIKAKHIAMFCCKQFTNLSLRRIGMNFSNKAHCDVLYAIKSVKNQSNIYRTYNKQLNEILEKLKLKDEEIQLENKYRNYDTDKI